MRNIESIARQLTVHERTLSLADNDAWQMPRTISSSVG